MIWCDGDEIQKNYRQSTQFFFIVEKTYIKLATIFESVKNKRFSLITFFNGYINIRGFFNAKVILLEE